MANTAYEINCGNQSMILGELMLLIESDKRDLRWAMRVASVWSTSEGNEPRSCPSAYGPIQVTWLDMYDR